MNLRKGFIAGKPLSKFMHLSMRIVLIDVI